jgi:hypothetical protein
MFIIPLIIAFRSLRQPFVTKGRGESGHRSIAVLDPLSARFSDAVGRVVYAVIRDGPESALQTDAAAPDVRGK